MTEDPKGRPNLCWKCANQKTQLVPQSLPSRRKLILTSGQFSTIQKLGSGIIVKQNHQQDWLERNETEQNGTIQYGKDH